jgi:hypothetical protein
MKVRVGLVSVGAVVAVCFGTASGAWGATQVGDPCIANLNAPVPIPLVVFPIAAPASPFPTAVPAAGVITSWGVNIGTAALAPGVSTLVTLKVVRPNQVTQTLQVVGESSGAATAGANTFNVRIPVQAGDALGAADAGGSLLACEESPPAASVGLVEGNPATGATVPFSLSPDNKSQVPIFATVEPDADGDGHGDETQDQCPTDASTHEACPVPKVAPASPSVPITLSVAGAAKKGFVTVALTSSAQADVTVAGSVKLGKGKPAKLPGSTQIVAPGSLATFTILFPAKMKAELKKLPPSKKLALTIAASAPGATTTNLTVKVAGQKKPPHHRRK